MVRRRFTSNETPTTDRLVEQVRRLTRPLRSADDLDPLIDQVRNSRVVMLGEASHGTHEFYTWRAELSKRLIQECGFNLIAVEGDWPDCYRINRFVKHYPEAGENARDVLETFRRWPTWMWANEEVLELMNWLRQHNADQTPDSQVGFYGLDVYSLWDSLYEVMGYLSKHQPDALPAAQRALRCFEPYGEDAQEYARATVMVPESCQRAVVELLQRLRPERVGAGEGNGRDGKDGAFVAEQNALVVKNAEAYYRAMVRSDSSSWNVRDHHMAETLDRLLNHHGTQSKAIVWEHNTHVGDARFTDMAEDGLVNVGQLARERYGREQAKLVGFASHRGGVVAGKRWDAPWEEMVVPKARPHSWEDVLHSAGSSDQLLLFTGGEAGELSQWRGHRAIGVVYRPEYEHLGNYVPTILPERYDALLYIDESQPLRPVLPASSGASEELAETYPFGA